MRGSPSTLLLLLPLLLAAAASAAPSPPPPPPPPRGAEADADAVPAFREYKIDLTPLRPERERGARPPRRKESPQSPDEASDAAPRRDRDRGEEQRGERAREEDDSRWASLGSRVESPSYRNGYNRYQGNNNNNNNNESGRNRDEMPIMPLTAFPVFIIAAVSVFHLVRLRATIARWGAEEHVSTGAYSLGDDMRQLGWFYRTSMAAFAPFLAAFGLSAFYTLVKLVIPLGWDFPPVIHFCTTHLTVGIAPPMLTMGHALRVARLRPPPRYVALLAAAVSYFFWFRTETYLVVGGLAGVGGHYLTFILPALLLNYKSMRVSDFFIICAPFLYFAVLTGGGDHLVYLTFLAIWRSEPEARDMCKIISRCLFVLVFDATVSRLRHVPKLRLPLCDVQVYKAPRGLPSKM